MSNAILNLQKQEVKKTEPKKAENAPKKEAKKEERGQIMRHNKHILLSQMSYNTQNQENYIQV